MGTTTITPTTITADEFIRREIAIWGDDYIFDLLDKGYEPFYAIELARWSWRIKPI